MVTPFIVNTLTAEVAKDFARHLSTFNHAELARFKKFVDIPHCRETELRRAMAIANKLAKNGFSTDSIDTGAVILRNITDIKSRYMNTLPGTTSVTPASMLMADIERVTDDFRMKSASYRDLSIVARERGLKPFLIFSPLADAENSAFITGCYNQNDSTRWHEEMDDYGLSREMLAELAASTVNAASDWLMPSDRAFGIVH